MNSLKFSDQIFTPIWGKKKKEALDSVNYKKKRNEIYSGGREKYVGNKKRDKGNNNTNNLAKKK